MDFSYLKDLITSSISDATVEIEDLTGTGDHLAISVTSDEFKGHPLLTQHRKIMEILKGPLSGELHAVKIKTQTY